MSHIEKITVFVKDFVKVYEGTLLEYYDRLDNQIPKQGKWADSVNRMIEISKGATEAIDEGRGKASSLVGMSILNEVISGFSKYHNRKVLKTLTCQAFLFKTKPDYVRGELVAAGVEVYLCFEAQFVKVIVDKSWERALSKVSDDAVDRAINYFKENGTAEFSKRNILTGVLVGSSKTYKHTSTGFPHLYKGHTVKTSITGEVWYTSEIFDRSGLAAINSNGFITSYFTKQEDQTEKYGFHLELENRVPQSYRLTDEPSTPYNYILKWECRAEYTKNILADINADDSQLAESRIKRKIAIFKRDMKEDVQCLKMFLMNNLTALKEDIRSVSETQGQVIAQINTSTHKQSENWQTVANDLKTISGCMKNLDVDVRVIMQKLYDPVEASLKPVRVTRPVLYEIKRPVNSYIKRTDEFHEITIKIDNNMVVVYGLGGVGKSELLLNYATECADKYQRNLIWINATTAETLKSSFLRLANEFFENINFHDKNGYEKSLDIISREIYEYLSTEKCLVIFDNAPQLSAIANVLPSPLRIKNIQPNIVVSSPIKWTSPRIPIANVRLKDFSPTQAHAFIRQGLNVSIPNSEVVALAKGLRYSPLALSHAISYIRHTCDELKGRTKTFTLSDYLNEFYQAPEVFLNYEVHDDSNDNTFNTVFRTIEVTLSAIADKSTDTQKLGMEAIQMINMLAYFTSNDIPEDIFLFETKTKKSKQDFIKISSILAKYSIVNVKEGLLNVHGLVQQVVRHQLKKDNKEFKFLDICLNALMSYIKESASADTRELCTPQIINLWNFASDYKGLVDRYVVQAVNYNGEFNFLLDIIKGCSYSVIKKIIENIPETELNRLLNCDLKPHNQALHIAALRSDKQIAELLLDHGARLQKSTENKWTPLLIAAKRGNFETLEYLVSKGASLQENMYGSTALHYSASVGHLELVKYCLLNLPVDVVNDDGDTALHQASSNGHLEVIKCLVEEHGADHNIFNSLGGSPLYNAIFYDKLESVKYLSSLHLKDCYSSQGYPLHYAAGRGSVEVCCFFAKDNLINVNEKDESGNTPLLYAVMSKKISIVELFVENGADLTIQDDVGWTALHQAVYQGSVGIVKYILHKNPYVLNMCAIDGKTASHLAAIWGHLDIIKLLVDNGADFDKPTCDGYPPIFFAAYKNHFNIVEYLIENNKVNFNIKSLENTNIIHAAVGSGNAKIVQYLLWKTGIKFITECSQGHSPLDLAVYLGNINIVNCMLKYKPQIDGKLLYHAVKHRHLFEYLIKKLNLSEFRDPNLLFQAASCGSVLVLDFLIKEMGYNVSTKTSDGFTILHLAACYNDRSVVDYLVSNFAMDPTETDTGQNQAPSLTHALKHNNHDVADYFLGLLETKNDFGWTKLHITAGLGDLSQIKYYYDEKYDFSVEDKAGYNPLLFAVCQGNLDIVRFLFDKVLQETALVLAIWNGHVDIVKYLVEEESVPFDFKIVGGKAPLDAYVRHSGDTPLLQAVFRGQTEIVKYLVDKKPDILLDTTDCGRTPLDLATSIGNLDLVQYLLDDKSMDCPSNTLYHAISSGNLNLVRYFVEEKNLIENDRVIPSAIKNNHLDILKYFLDEKKLDLTPESLRVALKNGRHEIALYLLTEKKAFFLEIEDGIVNLDVADDSGMNALQLAAHKGYTDIVSMLKGMGADITVRNLHDSLLHRSVSSRAVDTVMYVLEELKKCPDFAENVNVKDADGDTPLMWAIEAQCEEMVNILLMPRYQCELSLRNNKGETALDWAYSTGKNNIIHSILLSLYTEQCFMGHYFNLYLDK